MTNYLDSVSGIVTNASSAFSEAAALVLVIAGFLVVLRIVMRVLRAR